VNRPVLLGSLAVVVIAAGLVIGHGALWAVFDTWNRPVRNGRFRHCRSVQPAPVLSG
jgi:hypothetical protein